MSIGQRFADLTFEYLYCIEKIADLEELGEAMAAEEWVKSRDYTLASVARLLGNSRITEIEVGYNDETVVVFTLDRESPNGVTVEMFIEIEDDEAETEDEAEEVLESN